MSDTELSKVWDVVGQEPQTDVPDLTAPDLQTSAPAVRRMVVLARIGWLVAVPVVLCYLALLSGVVAHALVLLFRFGWSVLDAS